MHMIVLRKYQLKDLWNSNWMLLIIERLSRELKWTKCQYVFSCYHNNLSKMVFYHIIITTKMCLNITDVNIISGISLWLSTFISRNCCATVKFLSSKRIVEQFRTKKGKHDFNHQNDWVMQQKFLILHLSPKKKKKL